MISAIQNFGVSRFEIDERGSAVPGNAQGRTENLDSSVEKGPVQLTFAYSDEPQLLDGHGYRLSVSIEYLIITMFFFFPKCVLKINVT